MRALWPPQEFARKKELLGTEAALSYSGCLAIRAAECALASTFFEDEEPYFTMSNIRKCVGGDEKTIRYNLRTIMDQGLLTKVDTPPDAIYGTRAPMRFKPMPNDDGAELFRPQKLPGCTRTAALDTFDSLRPLQREVLTQISRLIQSETDLTRIDQPTHKQSAGKAHRRWHASRSVSPQEFEPKRSACPGRRQNARSGPTGPTVYLY